MVAQVGYSVAEWSRGRVTLCAVCTWHVETRSASFLVEPQNKGRRFMSGLASKPVSTIFSSMASKPAVGFLVEPQNQGGGGFPSLGLKTSSYWFGDLGLKITATVSWFGSRNQAGFGLSVAPQNRWSEVGADTRWDLAACLAWKQMWLGFPVWPEDWRRRDDEWCTWHHRGGCVRGKLKMDGSIRRAASDPATLGLPFSFY
jgi:hypothetical protein